MSPSRYFGRPVQLFFCGQGYLLLLLCAALCVAWFAVEKISLDIFLFATTALNDMHRQTNERTKGTLRRRGDTARGVEQRCLTTASSLWLCCEHDLRRRGPRGRGGRGPRGGAGREGLSWPCSSAVSYPNNNEMHPRGILDNDEVMSGSRGRRRGSRFFSPPFQRRERIQYNFAQWQVRDEHL